MLYNNIVSSVSYTQLSETGYDSLELPTNFSSVPTFSLPDNIVNNDSSVLDNSINIYIPDQLHHTGHTILQKIPNLGLVTEVPLDYMHLICLGVVKKLRYSK